MGSDWDYINEHMGGHDADGMPNFVHGFSDEENQSPYVDKSPRRPVEEFPLWLHDKTGLSIEEQLVLESLRTLTLLLKDQSDSAFFCFDEELSFYEFDKAEFEAGQACFYADELVEKKELMEEKELAYEIALDEYTVVKNAYFRARWLANQPAEVRIVLNEEAKRPPEELIDLVKIQVHGSPYPLFVATTGLSMDLNRELLLEAVRNPVLSETTALNFTNEGLKADRELVLEAVRNYGQALEYADDTLKADRELVLEAVRNSGLALQFAADTLKTDRELVLEAVRNYGQALEYADDTLKADRELVLEAVRNSGLALEYADDTLKADRELVLEAVRNSAKSTEFNSYHIELGRVLQFASYTLKADRVMMLEAVRNDGLSLQFGSDALKADRELVLEAVKNDGRALEFTSDALQADRELVLEAVRNNSWARQFASYEVVDDLEMQNLF